MVRADGRTYMFRTCIKGCVVKTGNFDERPSKILLCVPHYNFISGKLFDRILQTRKLHRDHSTLFSRLAIDKQLISRIPKCRVYDVRCYAKEWTNESYLSDESDIKL